MSRHRCLVDELTGPGEIEITGEEAHHIVRVKRLGVGDRLVVFDGIGREASADIIAISLETGTVRVRLGPMRETDRETNVAITLAAAVPKGKRAEFMIQKCAELGVRRFVPLDCARSVVNVRTRSETKIQKWQRICAEASKQSGRNQVMDVDCPCSMEEAFQLIPAHQVALIAALEDSATPLRAVLAQVDHPLQSVLYFVGPEGGFTRTELSEATRAGCKAVLLAPSILRTETAAIAGCAMLVYACH